MPQRPIINIRIWDKERFIDQKDASLRRWGTFKLLQIHLKRAQDSGFSILREGRRGRRRVTLGSNGDPRRTQKCPNLSVPQFSLH